MPKVNEGYLKEKRNFILECTENVLKEKPLYLITMRDIIKKAGFSQGVIYRYYSSLDDIYVDYVNKHTTNDSLEEKIDIVLNSKLSEKKILAECMRILGEYLEEVLQSMAGKTFFEFTVLYAYDFEKRNKLFSKLKLKQSIEYAQNTLMEYVMYHIEQGVFNPQIPVESIIQFMSSFIDGLGQNVAIVNSPDSKQSLDVAEMFHILSDVLIGFLEEK